MDKNKKITRILSNQTPDYLVVVELGSQKTRAAIFYMKRDQSCNLVLEPKEIAKRFMDYNGPIWSQNKSNYLSEEYIDRIVEFFQRDLNSFIENNCLSRNAKIETVSFATSLLRRARNRQELIARLDNASRVLEGEQEAFFAGQGATIGFPNFTGTVLDLGGGSLEIAQYNYGHPLSFDSIAAGVKKLIYAERTGKGGAISQLVDDLESRGVVESRKPLIVTGSAFRNLAVYISCLNKQSDEILTSSNIDAINKTNFGDQETQKKLEEIATGKINQTILSSFFTREPEEIIVASRLINKIIEKFGPSGISVSPYGVREGVCRRFLEKCHNNEQPPPFNQRLNISGDEVWLPKVRSGDRPCQWHLF